MGETELRVFSKALEGLPLVALGRVVKRLSTTPRGEFEPKIPELGHLIEMVRVEERRANRIRDCDTCANSRMKIVETEGVRQATRCKCWLDWKARQ